MAAELDERMPDAGTVISGRYRVDSVIATGSSATVFRAHHLDLQRDVAIKIASSFVMRHREPSTRFDREAVSLSRLDHPNCLRVIEYGKLENGLKYLVTELIDGRELGQFSTRPQPLPRVLDWMLQLFSGLEHAHDRGVVHRDLKVENILVASDEHGHERIKIVDFGIATWMDDDFRGHRLTEVGFVCGTPQYLSPEQVEGERGDARSDLYSAGVVMYALLAGRLPFDGPDPIEIARRQIREPVPPLADALPTAVVQFVMKLLAKNPWDRFGSASEAIRMLKELPQNPTGPDRTGPDRTGPDIMV